MPLLFIFLQNPHAEAYANASRAMTNTGPLPPVAYALIFFNVVVIVPTLLFIIYRYCDPVENVDRKIRAKNKLHARPIYEGTSKDPNSKLYRPSPWY